MLVPPLVVLLFVYVLYANMDRRRQSTDRVARAHETIGRLQELRARLVEAEAAQRGFIITGDAAFLDPYAGARHDVEQLLSELQPDLAPQPEQAALIAELRPLIARRLEALEGAVGQRRTGGFEAARESVVAGGGRESVERVRTLLGELEQGEERQLAAYNAVQERDRQIDLWILFVGAGIVGFVALLTNRLFARQAESAQELNRKLYDANLRLQEQAAELEARTRELQQRQTQLEETAAELSESNEVLRRYRAHLEESTDKLEKTNAELLRLNQLLEERTQEAESANRAKTGFLAAMSHELRTPLNAIGGYIDLLDLGLYGPVTPEQSNSYERIRYNSRHLLVLITDILSFAKIEAGRTVITVSDVDVSQLLQETESAMRPLFEGKDIRFYVATADRGLVVRGDRDRIRQILLNLLSNAVKYTDPDGVVSVITEITEDQVMVRVQDTGWGIAPDMQEAIFDPFVQVSRGPGGSLSEGVGLGLAISRALALEMHGTLTVTSSLGAGSTFTLTLPLSHVSAAAAAEMNPQY